MAIAEFALHRCTARALLDAFRSGRATPVEVALAYLRRIDRLDARLGSFVTVDHQQVMADAEASATRYRDGTAGALEGLPVAVKDLIDTAGLRTTYGSRIFERHVPEHDAAVVTALRAAGAIVLGKTATHEFAWGITTDGRAYGPTCNPWERGRTAGGSSGGSAAAVSARLAPVALGTDTVGSVRIPAAFCGVVGFKPTFGLLDKRGTFSLSASLDHLGVIARNLGDVRTVWDVLLPHGNAMGGDYPVDRVRFAVTTPEADGPGRTAMERLSGWLVQAGAGSRPFDLPGGADVLALAGIIVGAEGLRVHQEAGLWPARRADYEPDVAARLAGAELVTDAGYVAAQARRAELREMMAAAFNDVDVIAMPVSLAQPLQTSGLSNPSTLDRFRRDVMSQTALASLTGAPAITVPTGLDDHGLPLGVQLIAAPGNDRMLLDVAHALFPGDAQQPPLS